ncbi:MAG: 4-amino-4-deoxy-L-arabinose transferase [Armatimonadota bacterium]|nr:4-amino-4-deoxy-L-arabinose transferase [Armatimonadota bacterium]MDR7549025.1 4-amino-4-deoxy-L-arabinose transferase [Armatimonadota bacterium]
MTELALALAAVALNAGAQLLLRSAMHGVEGGVTSARQFASLLPGLMTSPAILGGLACYILSLGVWLVVLSRLPVSVAYPLQSLGYVMVVLSATVLLNEPLTANKLLAVALIVLGVLFLARGHA